MNSTERVLAAFASEPFDRVPYWDNMWGDFEEKWQLAIPDDPKVSIADYYGNDIFDQLSCQEYFFFNERKKLAEDADSEIWNNGWGATVKVGKTDSYFSQTIKRKINSCAEVEHLEFDPVDEEKRYFDVMRKKEIEIQKGRCFFATVGGIYCRSQFLRGESELLMDMIMEPEGVHQLFDKVGVFFTGLALQLLSRLDCWEAGLFVSDDMANSAAPMFSPDMFATFLLPSYKRLINTVKKAGCKRVFLHSDGNIGPLIDLYLEAGFDGFNPLEPRCGQDLVSLRQKYGKRFICLGGICNTQILPRGNLKEIEAHIRPLIELAKDGGIILGTASIGGDIDPYVYDQYRKMIAKYGQC